MLKEFKEFASRGNAMDLAIGIIIGTAFQKIVTSLVNDIIMPTASILTGKVDFTTMAFTINGISIKYGVFVTAVIDFLIIAFTIFLVMRYSNKINKKLEDIPKLEFDVKNKKLRKKQKIEEAPKEPETKECPYCLSSIKYKAVKCPNCVSDQPKIKEKNE